MLRHPRFLPKEADPSPLERADEQSSSGEVKLLPGGGAVEQSETEEE